ncbi:hypothetical protein ABHC39_04180 [Pediococcus acidilactici]|uniref:hypothetical protein n=1 Tax=Pediococcus acidilactici TaxID=1254 RepID=UPI00132F5F6F|nr:hypothetical protein [Pediococcus acidilactici]KAF0361379.1 hypothetical protein GBO49_00510 [Pediococcus acidilactici]KAF0531515.1 hypothetical protein GBP35_01490 [Pediococcus acidilactici]MDB8867872.1 hypothetical protein [Pediococcus acidilactici]
MAININIDDQLGLEYAFRIAGKKRELTYDDECAAEIERVQLIVNKLNNEIEDKAKDNLDDLPVDEQLAYFNTKYGEIKDALIVFFDKYFGDGAGDEFYEYYHHSTRALSNVFLQINKYLEQVTINKKQK